PLDKPLFTTSRNPRHASTARKVIESGRSGAPVFLLSPPGRDDVHRGTALFDRPETEMAAPGRGGGARQDELELLAARARHAQDLAAEQLAATGQTRPGRDLLDPRGRQGL